MNTPPAELTRAQTLRDIRAKIDSLTDRAQEIQDEILDDIDAIIDGDPDALAGFLAGLNQAVIEPMGYAPARLVRPRGPRVPYDESAGDIAE